MTDVTDLPPASRAPVVREVPPVAAAGETAGDTPAAVTAGRSWATWCLLAAAALALAVMALQAYRILTGAGFSIFEADSQDSVPEYNRVAAFVQFIAPDRQLVLPLLGLAAATWLSGGSAGRSRLEQPVRRVAAGLAVLLAVETGCLLGMLGYLVAAAPPADATVAFFGSNRLDELAGRLTSALLLVCLSVLLARRLLGEAPAATADTGAGAAPEEPAGQREDAAADPDELAAGNADPHAVYRRPPA